MVRKPADPNLDALEGEDEEEELGGLNPELDEEGAQRKRFVIKRDVQRRVDKYLQLRLKGISRAKVQKLIELGGVTVNSQPPKPSYVLKPGDVLEMILPAPAVKEILPEPIPLTILYEDDCLIVVNKQADLIVHPARGNLSGTLVNALAHHLLEQKREAEAAAERGEGEVSGLSKVGAGDYRPGIVHRLDRFTTGVMIVAKEDQTHWQLATQFERREPLKVYLAVVHGNFDQPGGVIEQPIGKHPTIREAYAVRHDSHGKASTTLYRVREQYEGYALVELELRTGRTHQIRVHLSHFGNPLVGDIVYGGEPVGHAELDAPPTAAGSRKLLNFARDRAEGTKLLEQAQARPDILMVRPALNATLLRITHPIRRELMTFQAPLHEPMATLVRELRKRPKPGAPVVTEGFHIDLAKLVPGE